MGRMKNAIKTHSSQKMLLLLLLLVAKAATAKEL